MGILWARFKAASAPAGSPGNFGFPEGWHFPKKDDKSSEVRRNELRLWQAWRAQGERPQDMSPLLGSLRPLIWRYGVRPWAKRGVPLQTPVLEAEATRLAIGGLRKFDPSRAQMNTYLRHQLKSMDRFVKQRQNFARITEERSRLIGRYQRADATLRERLEREPTVMELATEMQADPRAVNKLLQEMQADLLASGALEDPFVEETPKSRRALRLIRYQLTPDEEKVFDYLTGQGGKPRIDSTSVIAKREGWKDSKVSQLKKSIMLKLKDHV